MKQNWGEKIYNIVGKHIKRVLVLAVLIAAVVLVLPQEARADLIEFGVGALLLPIKLVAYLINFIGGLMAQLGAFFLEVMLNLNAQITGEGNKLVEVGWVIMRDVTNLGFVLVIIVIGFSTILGFKTYGMQSLLPKLIAAAILVNFSLTIGSVIINFSQIMTNFFYQKIDNSTNFEPGNPVVGGGGNKIATIISAAFGPQRLLMEDENPIPPNPEEEAGGLARFGAAFLTSLGGIFFSIIFTFLMAFILFVYAGMLFVRYLYLSFLLLVSPIIWLFWVVPDFQSHWSKWWSKFFSWTFFAPASAFFLYLALTAAENLGKTKLVVQGSDTLGLGSFMQNGAQMAVLGGLLMGGLVVAQQMGIAGAAGAIGLAKGVGKVTAGYVGKKALGGVSNLAGKGTGPVSKFAQKIANNETVKKITGSKAFKVAKKAGDIATLGLGGSVVQTGKQIATGEWKEKPNTIFSAAMQSFAKQTGLIAPEKEKPTKKEMQEKATKIGKEMNKPGIGDKKKQELALEKARLETKIQEENKIEANAVIQVELNNINQGKTIADKTKETQQDRLKDKQQAIETALKKINDEQGKELAKGEKADAGKLLDYRQYADYLDEAMRKVVKDLKELNKREDKAGGNKEEEDMGGETGV